MDTSANPSFRNLSLTVVGREDNNEAKHCPPVNVTDPPIKPMYLLHQCRILDQLFNMIDCLRLSSIEVTLGGRLQMESI